MDEITCPICNSVNAMRDLSFEKYLNFRSHQNLYKCKGCRHCWRTPQIANDLAMADRSELLCGLVHYGSYTANAKGGLPRHLVDRAAIVQRGQSILDYGSGDGTFIKYMRARGIDAWGVDPDTSSLVDSGLKKYIKKDVSNFCYKKFDYVHANHVLEHVANPVDTLRQLRRCIKEEFGLMLIEVPNELESLTSIMKRMARKRSNSATSLYEHQHYFSPSSLKRALTKSGFAPDQVATPWRIYKGFRGYFDYIASHANKGDVIYAVARAYIE